MAMVIWCNDFNGHFVRWRTHSARTNTLRFSSGTECGNNSFILTITVWLVYNRFRADMEKVEVPRILNLDTLRFSSIEDNLQIKSL